MLPQSAAHTLADAIDRHALLNTSPTHEELQRWPSAAALIADEMDALALTPDDTH